MKKYDFYGGLFWLLIGLFVSEMGIKFGLGTFSYPGPGFFPFLVGLILSCLSLGILVLAVKEKSQDAHFAKWPDFGRNVFITLAVLFAYSFSLEYLGYIIGSILLMIYLFKVPGAQRWWFSTLVTMVTIALTYYVFGILLQAQFPKGSFNIG